MQSSLEIIILAAGVGSRMYSKLPKVLHKIGGEPMLARVLTTASKLKPSQIQVIIGYGADTIKQQIQSQVTWILQTEQLGTGHAVQQASTNISENKLSLILYGDVPLIEPETLTKLINTAQATGFALLTTILDDPTGYGRIIRKNNKIQQIIEHKDANLEQLKITEINTGIMAVNGKLLKQYLSQLNNHNSQQEYYLTDIVAIAVADKITINSVIIAEPQQSEGINNRSQQAQAERYLQNKLANNLMNLGATIVDPNRIDIRGTVTVGQDVTIDINTIFIGKVKLGNNVTIGANTTIKNCQIANNTTILENCILEQSSIGANCTIGPFTRIRPETTLIGNNKIGNFVEIKKSTIGSNSKVNHLSYIGDTIMGENVNIGAGTITCNYDGAVKHTTEIADNVFVGSGSQLVAPIKIAEDTVIGAGSTLTKNVLTTKSLVLTRSKLTTINGWQRPKK